MPEFEFSPASQEESSRDRAQSWLARFAPLLEEDSPTDEDLRKRLKIVDALSAEAPELQLRLDALNGFDDIELRQTFRRAATQLDSLEVDLRKRLARMAPGDPGGIVDLGTLQERLDVRAARQEVGLPTHEEVPTVLRVETSPGNLGAGAFMGLFGLGWTAFTTFHATLMIGGMSKVFGPLALLLLGFYAIFFGVGFGMFWGAFLAASREDIELDGDRLVVRRRMGPITKTKNYVLAQKSRARQGEGTLGWMGSPGNRGKSSKPSPAVVLTDADGNPVYIGINATEESREATAKRVNAYLDAQA